MGYVDSSPPSFSSSGIKSALLYTADGGVNYSVDSALLDDAQASYASNMWLSKGLLTTRSPFGKIEEDEELGKTLNTKAVFHGSTILHIGTKLYKLYDGKLTVLHESLPDCKGFSVKFGGKIYIYTSGKIFTVDKDFNVSEEFPYAPLYKTSVVGSGDGTEVSNFKPNMLAPCVTVSYMHLETLKFPKDFDYTKPFKIYKNDTQLNESQYSVDETRFYIKIPYNDNELKLVYYSTDAKLNLSDTLFSCTVATSFGGATIEGTKIILAGNPDKCGQYFTSELANPLLFYEGNGGTIGTGSDNITAFSKQNGYLLIFTENSVNRMAYNYDGNIGGYFSIKTLSENIGCDCPESVAICDNRTVFANTSGIYIVDETDFDDVYNIVCISKNITDASGERGFTSVSAEDIKNGVSCVYDRKYMLCAGGKIFIWDFGKASFVSSSDVVKSVNRLCFFEFEGIDGNNIFCDSKNLYLLKQTDTSCELYMYGAENENIAKYEFRSQSTDFNLPHTKKQFHSIRFECKSEKTIPVEVNIFADGNMFYSYSALLRPGKDGFARFFSKLPRYFGVRFSFSIKLFAENTSILNIRTDYIISKDNLKDN